MTFVTLKRNLGTSMYLATLGPCVITVRKGPGGGPQNHPRGLGDQDMGQATRTKMEPHGA